MTNEGEFKAFEKTALAFLRTLGFTPTGYFPYDHCSDVSGSLTPSPPFRVPAKAMAEIVKEVPTRISIEGFHKLAKDSLAERLILICRVPLTDLNPDSQSLVQKLGIEFFDKTTISQELERKKVDKSTIQEYSQLYEIVGPRVLAEALPEVARQKIPDAMNDYVQKLGLKPWQVFEQAVFSVLYYCFNLTVKKYGEDYLFEHEPEGVAIVGDVPSFAFIYECKSAADSYAMTAQDELTYLDYILKKKEKVKVVERSELKYFVIVAPSFSGDIGERRERAFRETQVLIIFLPAQILRQLGIWSCGLPSNLKRLVDFKEVFKLEEVVVSKESVESYMKKFEDENRPRW